MQNRAFFGLQLQLMELNIGTIHTHFLEIFFLDVQFLLTDY